ncbi:hypothetical protein MCG45_16155 [Clostridium perfringens]|uniref:DUF1540 domain-containing protein n=1 Tax=Clostridium perfringens TaxID=1502 RepID=UPI001F06EEA2|nr:DUF1540 domain-containing protein [Clostridium perfringens]MCH1964363.1 hypothetical protein [Clostridium perfringens]
MIKCELDMCKNNKEGICNLKEINIRKSYDCEMGYFDGGKCSSYEPKQSYLDEESERTFKLMKISEDIYYAVRKDVYGDVDVEYIFKKHPNIKTLIIDNLTLVGTTKNKNRFWICNIKDGTLELDDACDKYNKLITEDMLKFTCDYIRECGKKHDYFCLLTSDYEMIKKGNDL